MTKIKIKQDTTRIEAIAILSFVIYLFMDDIKDIKEGVFFKTKKIKKEIRETEELIQDILCLIPTITSKDNYGYRSIDKLERVIYALETHWSVWKGASLFSKKEISLLKDLIDVLKVYKPFKSRLDKTPIIKSKTTKEQTKERKYQNVLFYLIKINSFHNEMTYIRLVYLMFFADFFTNNLFGTSMTNGKYIKTKFSKQIQAFYLIQRLIQLKEQGKIAELRDLKTGYIFYVYKKANKWIPPNKSIGSLSIKEKIMLRIISFITKKQTDYGIIKITDSHKEWFWGKNGGEIDYEKAYQKGLGNKPDFQKR